MISSAQGRNSVATRGLGLNFACLRETTLQLAGHSADGDHMRYGGQCCQKNGRVLRSQGKTSCHWNGSPPVARIHLEEVKLKTGQRVVCATT